MKLKIASALIASAALLPAAHAEGLSYSYLDLAYVEADFDDIGDNGDGFALDGSLEITDEIFMFASYGELSLGPVDFETYSVGGGYAWSFSPRADLYGTLAYVKAEADFGGFPLPISVDDDGYGVSVGIRHLVTDQFELEGSVNYVDLSDSGDDTSFGIGARWYFTPQFAVGAEASLSDDADTYGVGVRWNFGG